MNHDIIHCFDFKDDICPLECRLAKEEREFDGAADCSPVFLSFAHYFRTDICPLKGDENGERKGRFKEDSGSAGKEEDEGSYK